MLILRCYAGHYAIAFATLFSLVFLPPATMRCYYAMPCHADFLRDMPCVDFAAATLFFRHGCCLFRRFFFFDAFAASFTLRCC